MDWVPHTALITRVITTDRAQEHEDFVVFFHPQVSRCPEGRPLYGDEQEARLPSHEWNRIKEQYHSQFE